jgi:hypothetical protein
MVKMSLEAILVERWEAKVGLRKKKIASETTSLWEVELKSKLKELRRLEMRAFRPRHGRTDFYEYLNGLYNLCDWTDPKTSGRVGQRVAKLCDLNVRAGTTPIRIVIDATAPNQDRQTKSRWVQALDYALAKKAPPNRFRRFLDQNGGVLGCADAMAALRKQKRRQMPWARVWPAKPSKKP